MPASGGSSLDITDSTIRETYPALFALNRWGNVTFTGFHLLAEWPPLDLIQSVNVVPFVGDRCVAIFLWNGHAMLPGGTRELGETLEETARRELIEETGASFKTCFPFAYWESFSADPKPWRPFLAHPHFIRAVAWADVELDGLPTNPPDGEQIATVELLTRTEAEARFLRDDRPELAAIYALAWDVRARSRNEETAAS